MLPVVLGLLGVAIGGVIIAAGSAKADKQPGVSPPPEGGDAAGSAPPPLSSEPSASAPPAMPSAGEPWVTVSEMANAIAVRRSLTGVELRNLSQNRAAIQTQNAILALVSKIPVYGQVIGAVWGVLDTVGQLLAGDSSGGWDALPALTKKRVVLFGLGGTYQVDGKPWADTNDGYKSTTWRSAIYKPADVPAEQLEARIALINASKQARFLQIVKTPDDLVPGPERLLRMIESGHWPPPLQPRPIAVVPNAPGDPFLPPLPGPLSPAERAAHQRLVEDYAADVAELRNELEGTVIPRPPPTSVYWAPLEALMPADNAQRTIKANSPTGGY